MEPNQIVANGCRPAKPAIPRNYLINTPCQWARTCQSIRSADTLSTIGISSPSALAVLRLMTNSSLVDCCTPARGLTEHFLLGRDFAVEMLSALVARQPRNCCDRARRGTPRCDAIGLVLASISRARRCSSVLSLDQLVSAAAPEGYASTAVASVCLVISQKISRDNRLVLLSSQPRQ
jgi:hypothetical protein